MKVTPLSGALGAEIAGIDLRGLDEAGFGEVYAAFLEHQMIAVRDQALSPDELVSVAARFGEISDYPFAKGMEGHPQITEIIKEPEQTSNFGGMWHSDTTYLPEPPKCTVLHAVETPPRGGDTLFADMYAAFAKLSDGLKSSLRGLKGVSTSNLNAAALRGDHLTSGSMQGTGVEPGTLQALHPVVRTHPETGREALYVNPAHTACFENMTVAESRPLLDHLFAHSIQPEFTSRLSWQPGTLVVWDNRCSQHCAINDYDGQRRVMRRITIAGDVPR
ncbi:MAG: TauD/TfdA family dioxygenase [Pseudomonadota bacterium]